MQKNPYDEMLNKKSRVQSKCVCVLPNTAYAYKQTWRKYNKLK